jgi:hypothetical protein
MALGGSQRQAWIPAAWGYLYCKSDSMNGYLPIWKPAGGSNPPADSTAPDKVRLSEPTMRA